MTPYFLLVVLLGPSPEPTVAATSAKHKVALPAIQDQAGLFSPGAIKRAEAMCRGFEAQFGKTLRVEAYASIPADRQAEASKLGLEPFLAQWAQERLAAGKSSGALLLICKQPPQAAFAISEDIPDRAMPRSQLEQLRKRVAEQLGNTAPDEMLHRSMLFLTSRYQSSPQRRTGTSVVVPLQVTPEMEQKLLQTAADRQESAGGLTWWFPVLGGGLALWLTIGVIRALVRPVYKAPVVSVAIGDLPPPPSGGFLGNFLVGLLGVNLGALIYERCFGGPGMPQVAAESFGSSPGHR